MEWGRPKKRKLLAEINVVPLIDVMLVLLIVFMVTAPLITQGVKVELPQADAEPVEDADELSLEVWIDAEGNYFISLGAIAPENPEPVPLDSIGENVTRIMDQNPGVPVFLRADQSIDYGTVMALLSTLERAGAENVRLITDPPELEL